MKLIVLIFIFSLPSLANDWVVIQPTESFSRYDLRGQDGHDGQAGKDAYQSNCADAQTSAGIDGEDGFPGEDGADGSSVFIPVKDFTLLSNIKLNLAGGVAGKGGAGGKGAEGCHGGLDGFDGLTGEDGKNGRTGEVYLYTSTQKLLEVDSTKIVTLGELNETPINLSFYQWERLQGARELFYPGSVINEHYYRFIGVVKKRVKLSWQNSISLNEVAGTKLALTLSKHGLQVTTYSGAMIVYRVKERESQVTLIIDRVVKPSAIRNLELGRLRSYGNNTLLEVRENFSVATRLDTDFSLVIAKIDERTGREITVGNVRVPARYVRFDDDLFRIYIGRLNYPARYKRRGTKLKLYLQVNRSSFSQQRSFMLSGIFRI